MSVETVICLADQLVVKPLFADSGFIPCNQEDRLALRIEGKGHSPLAIGRTEPQLLHIRVAGALKRIHAGPPQLRAELRSEEHTSELQSLRHLVCRLLLGKKK